MRKFAAMTACIVLTTAGAALAAVGGGDITLKNKRGDVVFSHDLHVSEVGLPPCGSILT